MRTLWIRSLLAAATLLVLSDARSTVFGHGHGGAVDVVPQETVLGVPTSYLLPTTSIEPTAYLATSSYVVPTVYATAYTSPVIYPLSSTAYVMPTTYYRTTGLLRGRRLAARPIYTTTSNYYVATAYYPTATYYPTTAYTPTVSYFPTVLDYPIVATSASACCGGTVATTASPCDPVASAPTAIRTAPPSSTASAAPRNPADNSTRPGTGTAERPAYVVESEPAFNPQDNARSSDVRSVTEAPQSLSQTPTDSGNASPPAAPPADREPAPIQLPGMTTTPTPSPGGAHATNPAPAPPPQPLNKQANTTTVPNEPNPPRAPTAEDEPYNLPPPVSPSDIIQREARRPQFTGRTATGVTPHILSGKVVSSNTGEGEENVPVIISNRLQLFGDRVALTDAFGRYAVRLPDGDWTVKVTMPSGRTYAVSDITVSGQQIVDSLGRNVPSLTITR